MIHERGYSEYFFELMLKNRSNKEELLNEIFDELENRMKASPTDYNDTLAQCYLVLKKKK